MEIAAHSTGREDTRNKRARYAGLGVPEYWWFDQIEDLHGSKFAGEPLADGRYERVLIETVEYGILQGYTYC